MHYLISVFVWLFSIVVTVVVTLALQEPLQWLFAAVWGLFRKRFRRDLSGIWDSTYYYEEDGEPRQELQKIRLRQLGRYVFGRNVTGQAHWYRLRGELDSRGHLTGVWENSNNDYCGAFQLKIDPGRAEMAGKWIGFDRNETIQIGPWKLRKRSDSD